MWGRTMTDNSIDPVEFVPPIGATDPTPSGYSDERSAAQLKADIDASYEAEQSLDRPKRVRPSTLGLECARQLAYDVLWVSKPKAVPAHVLRLFETGQREELRLLDDLRRAGWEVFSQDPHNPKRQVSAEALDGHSFGYLDGIGRDRANNGPWRVIECKSHNKASFEKLEKLQSVEAAKPEHFAQLQIYMYLLDIPRGIYTAKCKDNDKEYFELVDLNKSYVERLFEKAGMLIGKRLLPPKIGASAKSYKCQFCNHTAVCHDGAAVDRNCRTCLHSRAITGGKWGCDKHKCVIDKPLMIAGCADYQTADIFN